MDEVRPIEPGLFTESDFFEISGRFLRFGSVAMLAMAGSTPLDRAERRDEWAFLRSQAVQQHSLSFAAHGILRIFRADAAYASPAIYLGLEEAGYFYAIRLPANAVLRERISHRLTRPVGRPSQTKVKWFCEDFEYQAASWDKPRQVIAKIEWHPGELFPHVGFIVTNLPMEPDWVVRCYNQRGSAEQHINEGKFAFHWTPLSCKRFRDNKVLLQLHVLAYSMAAFRHGIKVIGVMAD